MTEVDLPDSDGVPGWVQKLGITDRASGLERAKAHRDMMLSAAAAVISSWGQVPIGGPVFLGFLSRAQGLHEGTVSAIEADNPYAAFTVLRSYSENVAALLYAKDHPSEMDRFWRDTDGRGVTVGRMTHYAERRLANFKAIYSQLSQYAHPQSLSILAAFRSADDGPIQWSFAPTFKSEMDAVYCRSWVVELAVATSHLLLEFADRYQFRDAPGKDS